MESLSSHAIKHEKNGLIWHTFPIFEQFSDRLIHGFSTRCGGVSCGERSSLNLGFSRGDERECVLENWKRWGDAACFPWKRGVKAHQVHGTDLHHASSFDAGSLHDLNRRMQVDGLWTGEIALPLITSHADCVPLFFYAADRNIIAVSHAGWRGTVARMAEKTVAALLAAGAAAEHIYAAIGPSAGPCCFELGEKEAELFSPFADENGSVIQPHPVHPDKFLVDLWRSNRTQMINAGIPTDQVEISGLCTICHPELFFSHRRQGNERGGMAAMMMLRDEKDH